MLHFAYGVASVVKRAAEDAPTNFTLPSWAWLVFLAEAIVFLPGLFFISYTLNTLYPVLAMVEDPNPPAYEPVSLNEDTESLPDDPAVPDAEARAASSTPPQPITESLRATNRLLYSVGGWRSSFRGLGAHFALNVLKGISAGLFGIFVPSFFGTLLASLALVQLSTAWVHIAISAPQPGRPFWRRLPPLRKTFEATSIPVLLFWVTSTLAAYLPFLLAGALQMPVWSPHKPDEVPKLDGSAGWKTPVIFVVVLAVQALLVVPSHVLLVRVQASLLPPEEDAIVPFDRSFQGTVEPAVVGGKGFVSMKDAIKTVPRGSWVRLYLLYAKVWLVGVLFSVLIAAVIIPEVFLFARKAE